MQIIFALLCLSAHIVIKNNDWVDPLANQATNLKNISGKVNYINILRE